MVNLDMKNGDLSNQAGFTIGFRCVDFLVEYKESTFTDKVLNALLGKTKRAEVNESVRSYMEYLYRQTEYNVDLIIENKDYTEELKQLIDNMPFNRVVLIDKLSQVSTRLLTGDLSIYVDDDDYRRSLVNSQYAISFAQLNDYIKRRAN